MINFITRASSPRAARAWSWISTRPLPPNAGARSRRCSPTGNSARRRRAWRRLTARTRPVRRSSARALAEAIHLYNLHRGFSAERTWFSGKLFAIRAWSIPTRAELGPRLRALEPFYRLDGLRVDDIYLSRATIAAH